MDLRVSWRRRYSSYLALYLSRKAPIVVYQFNSFTNDFSTDASLLLPETGLGKVHRVIGYPSSKPVSIPGFPLPAVPDYSFVTVLGVGLAYVWRKGGLSWDR